MNVNEVDFITIPTEDFQKASDFYENVLGLAPSKQWGEMPAREFETGNVTIAVMQMDAFGQKFSPNGSPIAFQVDDVESARAELEENGVTFAADTMDSGVCHMTHFRDPDGNPMMLHKRYAPGG